ncbi:Protein of unknown function [Pyronema omphalodes CBS 100304]|uniref:Uncharacterized protein n=1 Tax=Pyronema omphalodes (strain CBS 100304) TaxID=1076935 RepID=U4LS73_PYROM|nr:Protein of unknown function [Pyronema omphalodes CBS 100304]
MIHKTLLIPVTKRRFWTLFTGEEVINLLWIQVRSIRLLFHVALGLKTRPFGMRMRTFIVRCCLQLVGLRGSAM